MQTAAKIWMNGKFLAWGKANIHILTHTLHYGGGAFEGIRFYKTAKGPAVFRLKEHVDRLFYSAGCLQMKIGFTKKEVSEAIVELIRVNRLEEGYIRPIAYYGYGKMGLDPRGCVVNLAIAMWPWGAYLGDKPVKAGISKYMRIHPRSTVSDAKLCGHYVNSIFASLDAHSRGFDEAILLDSEGNVAEGPGENIFIVQRGALITPKKGSILPGLTRSAILEIARREKIPAREATVTKKMLLRADEAFYSGTAAEISPIASVNKQTIGKGKIGPVTKNLKEIFQRIVRGEIPGYKNWLTYAKK